MLSVPTVIKGEEYSYRSLADGEALETVMLLNNEPLSVCLQFTANSVVDRAPLPVIARLVGLNDDGLVRRSFHLKSISSFLSVVF